MPYNLIVNPYEKKYVDILCKYVCIITMKSLPILVIINLLKLWWFKHINIMAQFRFIFSLILERYSLYPNKHEKFIYFHFPPNYLWTRIIPLTLKSQIIYFTFHGFYYSHILYMSQFNIKILFCSKHMQCMK